MELWFTSDTHFGHARIIEYAKRPFDSAHEMDEALIKGWNERVKPSDHIYHLGDVAMIRPRAIYHHILSRLNGHFRLVRGNHDIYHTKEYMEVGFEEIYAIRVIDRLMFTHIPVHPRSMGRFQANIHGHIHDNPNYDPTANLVSIELMITVKQLQDIYFSFINYSPIQNSGTERVNVPNIVTHEIQPTTVQYDLTSSVLTL